MMTVAVVIAGCLGHWGVPQKVKFIFVTWRLKSSCLYMQGNQKSEIDRGCHRVGGDAQNEADIVPIKTISIKTIMCRNFKGGWGMGSKSFLGSSFKPWSSDYKGPRGWVTITIITITIITITITIIIITRPKPAYGRQGLAGSRAKIQMK